MTTPLDELVLGTVNAPWKRMLTAEQLEEAVATGALGDFLPHLAILFTEVSPPLVVRFAAQHGISQAELSVAYERVKILTGAGNAALEGLIVSMEKLLERALDGIDALAENGTPLARWALGGGTALMIHHEHRLSKDIDIFIDDPQFLGLVTPRLNPWFSLEVSAYDEAAHYVKLRYPEGEIDLIVSQALSGSPCTTFDFQGRSLPIETSVEIALKKLFHRAAGLTPRDIFDIAVVLSTDTGSKELLSQLAILSPVKAALTQRLARLPDPFHQAVLAELDVLPRWEPIKAVARPMVQDLVRAIPSPRP